MTAARVLLLTADPLLRAEVLRLAAAAGTPVDTTENPAATVRVWATTATLLLGSDLVEPLAGLTPGRREHVHVVARGPAPEGVFRHAVAIGASSVVELPAAQAWLVQLLADVGDGAPAQGLVVGVLGGSGGVGASTLACALAGVSAAGGPALLVDLDPFGAGAVRLAGLDDAPGVTWPDLQGSAGRLGSRALQDALPTRERLAVLGWPAIGAVPPEAGLVREVVSAGRRGHTVVVLDLPRHVDADVCGAVGLCDRTVLLSGADVGAVAAAARVSAALRAVAASVHLVVRSGALDPEDVAAALELPLSGVMPRQRRLSEQVDLGLGPVHAQRGPVARAARGLLATLRTPSASGGVAR